MCECLELTVLAAVRDWYSAVGEGSYLELTVRYRVGLWKYVIGTALLVKVSVWN